METAEMFYMTCLLQIWENILHTLLKKKTSFKY